MSEYVNNSCRPEDPHWAIVVFKRTFIPGDERSKTNPGHGYPEHYEHSCDYIVYTTKDEWEKDVFKYEGRKDFMAIHVDAIAQIEKTLKVNLKH